MNTKPQIHTAYFGIKLHPILKSAVQFDADRQNIPVSEWIRNAIRKSLGWEVKRSKNGRGK
jgi:hypothetical protein